MALESKTNLQQDTIDTLQELIQVNQDSREGFHSVADHVDDSRIETLFRGLALQRGLQAEQLRGLVAANGEKPEEDGSYAASAHRTWIDLRAALGGGTAAMLSEAERGEDMIKEKYESALKQSAGSAVTDVLNQQYAAVKEAHDRIRDLRDSFKKAK
jgi:uncharacterized protein (TIGR02284 family)